MDTDKHSAVLTELTDEVREHIEDGLKERILVVDLDRCPFLDAYFKIEYAYAIGLLQGRGSYDGWSSRDETWTYEYVNGNNTKHGGVAVLRDGEVTDFYHVYTEQL